MSFSFSLLIFHYLRISYNVLVHVNLIFHFSQIHYLLLTHLVLCPQFLEPTVLVASLLFLQKKKDLIEGLL